MMAFDDSRCPHCGSRDIGEGRFDSNALIRVKGKAFAASRVSAHVCGNCGCIFNLHAEQPQKFSRREE